MNIDLKFIENAFPQILAYLPVTLELVAVSMVIALVFGILFAYVNFKKIRVISPLIRVYMSLIRGTPVILQLYVIYNITPYVLAGILKKAGSTFNIYDLNPIYYAFFALSLMATVSVAEAVRAGLSGVDRGQMEAGLSVGMTELQTLLGVVFPQAVTTALPVLGNVLIDLIKSTSLAFVMTVVEITARAKILGGNSLRYFEGYLCVFLIYVVVIKAVEILLGILEKRLNLYRRGNVH